MTDEGGGIWSFDLEKAGLSLDSNRNYGCIFTADWGVQTCELIIGPRSMGDTAYCTGGTVENRVDSNKKSYIVKWRSGNYGNPSSVHRKGLEAEKTIREAKETIARTLRCDAKEIYLTSGGTESDNWALIGSAYANRRKGNHLITTAVEHAAIRSSMQFLEDQGFRVTTLPVDRFGRISPEDLRNALDRDTILVSVMYVNNEVGTIEPVEECAQIVKAFDPSVIFHTDAVQAVGHLEIDVKELGVDMLSSSAHKYNGPKGIGFLYVKKGVQLNSFMDGGAQEFGKRAGTENVALIVGMAVALENNCKKINEHRNHLLHLENVLLGELRQSDIDFIRNGSENHVPGNISLSFKNCEGEMILHRLDLKGICVSTGSACNSKETEISHVLEAMHVPYEYVRGTIRISLGKDNTEEEVRAIAAALKGILDSK